VQVDWSAPVYVVSADTDGQQQRILMEKERNSSSSTAPAGSKQRRRIEIEMGAIGLLR